MVPGGACDCIAASSACERSAIRFQSPDRMVSDLSLNAAMTASLMVDGNGRD